MSNTPRRIVIPWKDIDFQIGLQAPEIVGTRVIVGLPAMCDEGVVLEFLDTSELSAGGFVHERPR